MSIGGGDGTLQMTEHLFCQTGSSTNDIPFFKEGQKGGSNDQGSQ